MTDNDAFAANRAMWNETAAIHAQVSLPNLLEAVQRGDFSTFDEVERRVFAELELRNKDVAQLCCNNARELVSVKKAGAARCVGFDFSEAFLEQGRRLATAAGVELELLHTNVYEIPANFSGAFDVVYVTVGALGWLPDLVRFMNTVARLLRPGGDLFVYEMHPVLFLFDELCTSASDPHLCRSYFQRVPEVFGEGPDYLNPESTVSQKSYWHQHTLGTLLSSVLQAGLTLRAFDEYPHDISNTYRAFAGQIHQLPLCYSLLARRPP